MPLYGYVAQLVYIDETGSVGRGAKSQPLLTLAAAVVDESKVQSVAEHFRGVAIDHLGTIPTDFELHGHEIWGGRGHWSGHHPETLIAVYEQAISALDVLDIDVASASIHKQRLHDRYNGVMDDNAYVLALQFLLEKIDIFQRDEYKILVADEAKEHQLRAIGMVANLQDWGRGEVPGRKLETVIDSMHFVTSHASPGVQLADLVAYAIQRRSNTPESHPNAAAAITRIHETIVEHTRTYRQVWPADP